VFDGPVEYLKAYIDESFDKTVFVVSGYVAPTDEWEKFSTAWNSALSSAPSIDTFKMRDAMRLAGEFAGWTETDRDDGENHKLLDNLC
jgi:hypothetical protein